jgi:hypothetical protein
MAIGLEAKGYKESETRAGKRHRNRQKVAKRDERAQELSHKALIMKCANAPSRACYSTRDNPEAGILAATVNNGLNTLGRLEMVWERDRA